MSLDQQKLDGLLAQLEMAQSKYPVSIIHIALLNAQRRKHRRIYEN